MMPQTMTIEPLSADEPILVMTRTFDAPRELVWTALTTPEHVVAWYGGHGFENPVCEMDVRPGGRWRHVMRTPDGVDVPIDLVFVEVKRPERLVWQRADHGEPRRGGHPTSVMTITLEERGPKTLWKLVTRFASFADRDAALGIGFTHVLAEGVDKLAEVLRRLSAS